MRTVRAFSLVELLVTLSILALVLGIVLGALGRARERAMMTRCQSNLRSLGQALSEYANQNRGAHIPYSARWSYDWRRILDLQEAPWIVCPTGQDVEWVSYMLNTHLSHMKPFRVGGVPSSDVVLAGENHRTSNQDISVYLNGHPSWDAHRHGRLGANYLYLDYHVEASLRLPMKPFGAADDWQPWRPR